MRHPFFGSSVLAAVALLCYSTASAHAVTTLTGSYDNSSANGYTGAAGKSYILTSTAIFDDNGDNGFVGSGGDVTVDGADFSGNQNGGLSTSGDVTINSGIFDNDYFEGLDLVNGDGIVNSGIFIGGQSGIQVLHATLTINGAVFGQHTFNSIEASDGAIVNIYGGDFTGDNAALVLSDSVPGGGFDAATANIYGGVFAGVATALYTAGTTINVYGNFIGGSQTLQGDGSFTGALEDGGGLQTISYYTADDAGLTEGKIVLVNTSAAPEPSQVAVLSLMTLGLGGLLLRARNQHKVA